MLPAVDMAFLESRFGIGGFTISADAGYTSIIIPEYSLPPGYNCTQADLLLRLQNGYPDCQPDMWWFSPAILKTDNTIIPNTDTTEHHLGRDWQRWSRHLPPGTWRAGIDSLESYFALLRKDIGQWVGVTV